jgi:glutamate-1-semialdehyde 2,1-aminomutase
MKSAYEKRTSSSRTLFEQARGVFAGGVNHNGRFYEPYPIFARRAKGQYIWDEDGNRYADYWMGHLALILGHSPGVVTEALESQIRNGTHFGMASALSIDLGEEVQRAVPCAEMMRFCNSGAEATMYLVRLARAYSRKRVVVKMAGGWHGYNTELNKGVHRPFDKTESAGILKEEQAHVRTARFNDLEAAERSVKEAAGDVAAIFLEPMLGAGGCIPADKDYLKGLRELADKNGTLLAFDEIITGFRVALGGAQELYGVRPDMASLGKVMGGGLPIGMVCGLTEIMSLASPKRKDRFVSIGGGTFSENPLSMAAGLATVRHLRKNASTLYPRLNKMGLSLRRGVDRAMSEKFEVHTTGIGSMFLTHFGGKPTNAEESANGDSRAASAYAMHLLTSGTYMLPGHLGAVSAAHRDKDVGDIIRQSGEFTSLYRRHRKIGK